MSVLATGAKCCGNRVNCEVTDCDLALNPVAPTPAPELTPEEQQVMTAEQQAYTPSPAEQAAVDLLAQRELGSDVQPTEQTAVLQAPAAPPGV